MSERGEEQKNQSLQTAIKTHSHGFIHITWIIVIENNGMIGVESCF